MARPPTTSPVNYREQAWHALELVLSGLDVERAAVVAAMEVLRPRGPVSATLTKKRSYKRKPKPEVAAAASVSSAKQPDKLLPKQSPAVEAEIVKQILALLRDKHRTADVAGLLHTDIDGARVVLKELMARGLVTRGPGGHWHRAEGAHHEQG